MTEKAKNFLRGVATTVRMWPNTKSAGLRFLERSDAEALYRDWEKVGGDIRSAMEQHEHEHEHEQEQ